MITTAYINMISQLESEQRSREIESDILFRQHKTCHVQRAHQRANTGNKIERLRAMIIKKLS